MNGDPEFESRLYQWAMAFIVTVALWAVVLLIMGLVML